MEMESWRRPHLHALIIGDELGRTAVVQMVLAQVTPAHHEQHHRKQGRERRDDDQRQKVKLGLLDGCDLGRRQQHAQVQRPGQIAGRDLAPVPAVVMLLNLRDRQVRPDDLTVLPRHIELIRVQHRGRLVVEHLHPHDFIGRIRQVQLSHERLAVEARRLAQVADHIFRLERRQRVVRFVFWKTVSTEKKVIPR